MKTHRIAVLIIVAVCIAFAFAACGVKTVKGFQASKAIAESVLYESRILFNQGKMDAKTFDAVRASYDKLKTAQDAAINARIAYLKSGLEADKQNLEKWSAVVAEVVGGLTAIATQFGFADKVLIGG